MMKRITYLLLSFLLFATYTNAQQLPHFRNHSFNIAAQNPAYISMKEIPDLMINHRSQWVGFSGAPRISSLAGKYMFADNMGASATVMSDRLGLTQKLDFNLGYSYVIKTELFNVGFGLSWTLTQYKILASEMSVYDSNDQIINLTADDKTWKPDANAGILISSAKYFAGFSILQLFRTKYTFFGSTNEVPGLIRDSRHVFITGGYHLKKTESLHTFSPVVNMYLAKGTPFKFDIIANYNYNNAFMSSLNFSKGDALIYTAGYRYDRFVFSYSFDIVLSRLRNISSGAHEICIGMYFGKSMKNDQGSSPMF